MDKARRSVLAEGIVDSRVIPHGVDLEVFKPGSKVEARGRLGLSETANVLLFVGQRFGSNIYKDFTTLRQAVRIVGREMPVLLLAVGDKGQVEHHGKAEIRYVSYVEDKRAMANYYLAADVYVHAARVETFPTTVLEALACGTPVVAASVGGVPEQITDGHNGLLVGLQEPRAMAKQTLQLLRNRELRETMGRSAVAFARKHYDIRTEAQRYLDWYEELLVPAERIT
jgi:glycosyltransferase involved in cell wall biosynthesis